MAKKSRKRVQKTGKAKATEVLTPRYMRGKKPKAISFHKIADVLAVIEQHGHGKKFKRQARAADHMMTLHPDTVNFIKDFLAKNKMHTHRLGRKAILSDGDYDCD